MYITGRTSTCIAKTAVLNNFGDRDVADILLVLVTYLTMFHQNPFDQNMFCHRYPAVVTKILSPTVVK